MISGIRRFVLLATLPAALVAGCGGTAKTTHTRDTTTHKDTPTAQSANYHVGEHCQQGLVFAYSAQGFTCVNGRLRHKTDHGSPPAVHHHSHTTTAAPQGY
jgi:hypothetical protein